MRIDDAWIRIQIEHAAYAPHELRQCSDQRRRRVQLEGGRALGGYREPTAAAFDDDIATVHAVRDALQARDCARFEKSEQGAHIERRAIGEAHARAGMCGTLRRLLAT
jgi:hypothetical protein